MEDLELLSFNIISAVGTAKSRYVQAMYLAEKGDFDEARAKIKEGEEIMAATVFNDAQVDIINMMQWVKSPEALADLKQAISDFFAKKVKEEMDAMWMRGEMTQEKVDSFADLHERTPYRK